MSGVLILLLGTFAYNFKNVEDPAAATVAAEER